MKVKGREVIVKADCSFFSRMLGIVAGAEPVNGPKAGPPSVSGASLQATYLKGIFPTQRCLSSEFCRSVKFCTKELDNIDRESTE